ncbi:MAG: hypothetical protein HY430_02290 [Candidatus Levybacteria bacterium]|nr:hypothetical protein [Candidatus Levybacteria bacterium]
MPEKCGFFDPNTGKCRYRGMTEEAIGVQLKALRRMQSDGEQVQGDIDRYRKEAAHVPSGTRLPPPYIDPLDADLSCSFGEERTKRGKNVYLFKPKNAQNCDRYLEIPPRGEVLTAHELILLVPDLPAAPQ